MQMVQDLIEFLRNWHGVARFVTIFAAAYVLGWALRSLIFRSLLRAAKRAETDFFERIVERMVWPARLWVMLLSLVIATRALDERDVPASIQSAAAYVLAGLLILSLTLVASRLTILFLEHRLEGKPTGQKVTTLTRTLIRLVWLIPAIFFVLDALNISLAPALTALGVGGLAVSLALKDTLANIFAGLYVSFSNNIHKGDYIKMDGGHEGYVEDILWRVTTLRTMQNNLVVIPNSRLNEACVTNFSFPEKPVVISVPVIVHFTNDLDLVERVLLDEAAKALREVKGLMATPPPVVRFNPGVTKVGLCFNLYCHVSDYEVQFPVLDALKRRILRRLLKEGIILPFQARNAPGAGVN